MNKITTAKQLREELFNTLLRTDKTKLDLHEVHGVLMAWAAENELYYKLWLANLAKEATKGAGKNG